MDLREKNMYVCTHVFVSDHVHAMSEYKATLFVNQIGISDTHTHTPDSQCTATAASTTTATTTYKLEIAAHAIVLMLFLQTLHAGVWPH